MNPEITDPEDPRVADDLPSTGLVDPEDRPRFAELRARLAAAACARLHPQLHAWTDAAGRLEHVLTDIDAALARCSDLTIARRDALRFGGPDAAPADYIGRLLAHDGAHALTGLRFKGMRRDHPFLEVVATDLPPDSPRLPGLLAAVAAAWAPLAPRALRLFVGSHEAPPSLPSGARRESDLRVLVAPVAELQQRPPPPQYDALTLRRCVDLEFYPRFRAAYGAFNAGHPALAESMYLSTAEDLQPVVAGGHLYEAWHGEQWAGLVAAARERCFGRDSWLVHEELLAAPFRGRGLGPALQRRLIDHLDPAGGALLYGTIHADNPASIATARRVGRLDVGGHVFVIL